MPGPNDMQPAPGNVKRMARLQKIMQRLFDECLVRDFHGTANVELQIKEGVIQNIIWYAKHTEIGSHEK